MSANISPTSTAHNNIRSWLFRDMKPFPRWPVTLLLAVCTSVAIGTSSYLMWAHVTASPIAGCGGGGGWVDCEGVANSRWSLWFGVPVSLLALGIYLVLAAALAIAASERFSRRVRKTGWTIVTAAVFAAGMSAVWFIAIQFLLLQHICLYCMLAHACGLIAAATMVVAGPLRPKSARVIAAVSVAGLMILVGGQMLTRPPATFQIETFDVPAGEAGMEELDTFEMTPPGQADQSDEGVEDGFFEAPTAGFITMPSMLFFGVVDAGSVQAQPPPQRIAVIQGGAAKLKVADWPHIGPSDAKFVVVELFDYNCPPCRETFETIRGARSELGGQVAIVLLPVPLNADCNPSIKETGPRYVDSCNLSKLAVAMWRLDQDKFSSLHNWMLGGDQPPSYAEALAKANTMVDPDALKAELASGVPDQFIARHVALYRRVGEGSIPKLMFPRTSVVGKYTSVKGLIDLIRREGG
ncbi:Vitamin K epoxide reductase family protein [Rubripirellula obstinata]|uniref:Vitamin K epoxide reductase family protein n=1 Tax=Rubripirellula obstinata TaxID=406547 RepID=A0A5B1CPU8_9BACT|nr:vitamin K epoxide reductase family protein [Rubripirellula obstinata]KAA1261995.1 Vitamin K epoxide reductase family protein [Rubripirellula obstinata]